MTPRVCMFIGVAYSTNFPGPSSQLVRLKQCFGRCVARLRKIFRTWFMVDPLPSNIFATQQKQSHWTSRSIDNLMLASCNGFFLFQNSWSRQDPETMHVLTAMCRLITTTGFSVHLGWAVQQLPGVLEYDLSEEWVMELSCLPAREMIHMWLYDGSSL